jgi:hypothetical protein
LGPDDEGIKADRACASIAAAEIRSASAGHHVELERNDMSTTQTDSRTQTSRDDELRQQVQDLRREMEVQAATNAGAQATQAATHAGTWATMLAGSVGLIVGLFLALAFSATRRQ